MVFRLHGARPHGECSPVEVMVMRPDEDRQHESIGETPDVASNTECTGLVPALDDDRDTTLELYAVHRAINPARRKRRK